MINYIKSLQDFLSYDFLIYAMLGSLMLAILCGIISPFVVGKRYAFIGESISHSTLLGLNLSLMALGNLEHTLLIPMTFLITFLFVLFLAYSTHKNKLPPDGLIGVFLVGTLSMALITHFLYLKDKSDLTSILFGNILLLDHKDLMLVLCILIFTIVVFWLKRKQWLFYLYDEEGAAINGIKTSHYHYLFYLILTLLIVSTVKLSGTILINAFLIIPGIYAYQRARSISQVFVYSLLYSITTTLLALTLCNFWGTPPGATIAFIQFIILILAQTPRLFKRRKLL
jgi:ABC-type Mn2+/Zn2+ transport system permease subunit